MIEGGPRRRNAPHPVTVPVDTEDGRTILVEFVPDPYRRTWTVEFSAELAAAAPEAITAAIGVGMRQLPRESEAS